MNETNVLVIGARHHSLGWHISAEISKLNIPVHAGGLYTEPINVDCTNYERLMEVYDTLRPTHVICTVGANKGGPVYEHEWWETADDLMQVNYLAPMKALTAFEEHLGGMPGTFIAISSNSAQIPRSSSAAYCASKAALSMGIRCAARDLSRAGKPLRVWGYEPGALLGTPMTREVRHRIGPDIAMSRMLTNPAGMPVEVVARMVARDALDASEALHGCMVRLDNGEQ